LSCTHSIRSTRSSTCSSSDSITGLATKPWQCASARRGGLVVEQVGRDEDHGKLLRIPARAQQGGGLPAVQVVHADVQQHQVGWALLHDLQALAAAGGLADLEAQRQQQAGQQWRCSGWSSTTSRVRRAADSR
jgi:hypothetical protein